MDKNAFVAEMQRGYGFQGDSILLGAGQLEGEVLREAPVKVPLRTLNRHGLITGATGTGKTKTLSLLAEGLSEAGVPVLLMDIKGDLSGLALPGTESTSIQQRQKRIGFPWEPSGFPVEFLSLSKEKGIRLRATVHEFGPILFSKMLGLNETQGSLVSLVFKFCDDKQLPLVDLKDFKKVLEYIAGEAKANVQAEYGLVSTTSMSLILRKLIELEQQGAQQFFGERSFEVEDLLRTDNNFGVISILRLADLQDRPTLFSSFMLQMLAEVYATLPEAGDVEKPKLVMFIDEAHLMFEQAEPALLEQIESVVRLIRSKGVGIFFCTQSPNDIPAPVLNQLGLKIQHALRAFTAKDRREIKSIAENYPDSKFYQIDELLTSLGIGEALVTALDDRGIPTPLVATLLAAPRSRMGPLTPEEIDAVVAHSAIADKYNTPMDRESAYEMLGGKLEVATQSAPATPMSTARRRSWTPSPAERETAEPEEEPALKHSPGLPYPRPQTTEASPLSKMMGGVGGQIARQVGRTAAATVTGAITRSLLGVLGVGGRRRSY
jgi:DNA helicase HerA-like ATPase